jgi:hypothetical protein
MKHVLVVLPLMAGLAACQSSLPMAGANEPAIVQTLQEAPPGAAPGTCWGKDISPAVIETVTQQVVLQPAEVRADGTVVEPAIYKTETRQAIVQERRVTWFETPCSGAQTPDFVASVQRALKVRGLYRGPITGDMDARTRAAVRAYQKPEGLDSGILSLAAARRLGLVAVELPGG